MPITTDDNPGVVTPLTMTAEWAGTAIDPFEPSPAGTTPWEGDRWRVTFTRDDDPGRAVTFDFYMGVGHDGREPTGAEVIECVALDCAGVDEGGDLTWRTFGDWCAEYGYDDDSRRAERIYEACKQQARDFFALLGEPDYAAMLWGTEA